MSNNVGMLAGTGNWDIEPIVPIPRNSRSIEEKLWWDRPIASIQIARAQIASVQIVSVQNVSVQNASVQNVSA